VSEALLEVAGLSVRFTARVKGRRRTLTAVDGVDFSLGAGEIAGLVGESGSGKSTVARAVSGLTVPSAGSIRFRGATLPARRNSTVRRAIQMVFQDPYSSLNPRMSVRQHLAELLRVHDIVERRAIAGRCAELLELVGLPNRLLDARPRGMSGGQRQRVAIARALALEPNVLVADEPVSALDVSVQAGIINLFATLRDELDLAILFIAHDLSVVRNICDRVSVIYMGRIVESARTDVLFGDPQHPYTQGLLGAVPRLDGARRTQTAVAGDPPSLFELPSGCRFRSRCPVAQGICVDHDPELLAMADPAHPVACHFPSGRLQRSVS